MVRNGLIYSVVVVSVLTASFSFGQYGPPYDPSGMGGGMTGMGSQQYVIAVQSAQQNLREAQQQLDRREELARKNLNQSTDWVEMVKILEKATKDRDAIKEAILAKLKELPAYKQAVDKLAESEAVIAAGYQNQATSRQVMAAADTAIDMRLEISRLETEALESSVEYKNAEAVLRNAKADYEALWLAKKQELMQTDRQYRFAVEARDAAEAELKLAQDDLRLYRQQMVQQPAPQRQPRTRDTGGGPGGGRMGGGRGGRY